MAKQLFDLKSLHHIQRLKEVFEENRQLVVRDCRERPALNKARKIVITFEFKPHQNEAEDVVVETLVSCRIPNKAVDTYRMQTTTNNGLKFEPASPMQPDQDTLDFEDDDE